jgi:putative membrane protein
VLLSSGISFYTSPAAQAFTQFLHTIENSQRVIAPKTKHKKMKKSILYFLITGMMFATLSCGDGGRKDDSAEVAEDQNEETLSNKERDNAEFAVEAADAGLMEVELGTLALTKASSSEVKRFGQMMVDDHTKANNELKALAQQKNITLPTTMGNERQRKVENLTEKTGADFDKEYIDLMVRDHKEVIDEFEDQAEEGKDSEIKAWASSKVAALRNHLQEAERIQESLKKNNNNNNQ